MILDIKGLKKHFEVGKHAILHAVDGVDLSLGENEVLGLVGESGCGKSTLGRTLAGLHEKTSGEVVYRGESLPARYSAADFRRLSREIQMIFQDPYSSLNPRMTVKEIISEGPVLHGLWSRHEVQDKAGRWLERVGLDRDHLSRYPHEFSGGQRQRIGIARALALEPKVLICDEPISALDVSVQAQVVNLLEDLKNTMGLSVLFIAHDLSMVRTVSDRMAVMYLGSIVELGPSNDVYFRPLHPYTRSLVGSNPEPDPIKERQRQPAMLSGEVPSPVNVPAGCRFAGRCPAAIDRCRVETPSMRGVKTADGPITKRQVACHLYP